MDITSRTLENCGISITTLVCMQSLKASFLIKKKNKLLMVQPTHPGGRCCVPRLNVPIWIDLGTKVDQGPKLRQKDEPLPCHLASLPIQKYQT